MMRPSRLFVSTCAVASAIFVAGCGDDGGGGTDTGVAGDTSTPMDSTVVLPDGRVVDTGVAVDGCVPSFEICGDGMDQNCDGREDSCGNTDMDSFEACRPGQSPPACDCNDREASVYPGAPETCNGVDDDCDGRVDEIASCCPACEGMAERADTCTTAGACVCAAEGAGDAPCAAGQACCASGCADLQTDFDNCGLCQAQCTDQADNCSAGLCQCGTGPTCEFINMCVSGACS